MPHRSSDFLDSVIIGAAVVVTVVYLLKLWMTLN